ncbi:unnamed protein product [Rotaria magnacalcarata]|uniref:Uncharacterized protein n=2 Tax=Rotaria magnacalcarata TaxID=392030 RepID=A0A816EUN2_9BILA|nr:unnamed protein product [Rotaria magnacalcarata]CAF1654146.1 unnamed protein product [Rotaria magnacalcarata]CAF1915683.1 unnamed protein product [Rotaria magnacalcarata]
MLINSKNRYSSMDSFYNSNSNHKISQYYLSINNNQKYHRSTSSSSSSSLSLSSISSSLINQSRNLLKTMAIRNPCRTKGNSLSTTSLSSSMSIILHVLNKKNRQEEKAHHRKNKFSKKHRSNYQYNPSNSSSSSSLPRQIRRKKQLLDESICSETKMSQNPQAKKINNSNLLFDAFFILEAIK